MRLAASLLALPLLAGAQSSPVPPAKDYLVLVASESVDRIALIRFGPKGAKIERERYVGWSPTEVAGPHGLAVSPDKKHYFVSTAHGTPFGRLLKFNAETNAPEGSVGLGNFPATMQVSPDGHLVFVVNFNLHGEMVASDVSVVATDEMVEIARIPTCTMPHGSRMTADGTKQYSVCMMDETLVEIDAQTLGVSRNFFLTAGKEMGMTGAPAIRGGSHDMGGHGMEPPKPGDISCSPTWAQPSADGSRVWVACNKSSEIVEIDAKNWKLTAAHSRRARRVQSRPHARRHEAHRHEQARPVGVGDRHRDGKGARAHSDDAQGGARRRRLGRRPLRVHLR